jgi:oligopeptide/dipeptide ABC transporter ATP-binding protein
MYAGRVAEAGTANDLFRQPRHPYAWGLLGSMPRLDAARIDRLRPIPGTPPSLINVPAGCPFHPRCTYPPQATLGSCDSDIPTLREVNPGHRVACHLSTSKMRDTWQRLSDPTQSGETTDPVAAADPVFDAAAAATPAGRADYAEPYGPSDPSGPDGLDEPIFPADPNYPSIANLTSPADPAYPTEPTGSSEVEA